jgi:hypothetical protein
MFVNCSSMEMSECGMALFVSLYQWQIASCRFIQRAQQIEQKLNLGRSMKLLLLSFLNHWESKFWILD